MANCMAQDAPPSREPFFISSKIRLLERDIKNESDFLANFNAKYGSIEEKFNLNRALYNEILNKEKALEDKAKKTKQEKSFLKMSYCLKSTLDYAPKNNNLLTYKVEDCYRIYHVKPNLFTETNPEDQLSKLLGSLGQNFVDENFSGSVQDYIEAKARKERIENGLIDAYKNKISKLEQELDRRKKFDAMIEKNLMGCKTELTIPLKDFKDVKPSENYAYEAANDLLMSVTSDYKISNHTYYNINKTTVDDIFTDLIFKGYCTDRPRQESLENCEEDKSDLEKVATIFESCFDRDQNANNLTGMSSLSDYFKKTSDVKEKKQDLENLRRTVVTNLSQGITVTAKIDKKNNSIIGIKEDKGVCKYQIRDFSKKETYWISESELLERLNEIKYLVRYTRPED